MNDKLYLKHWMSCLKDLPMEVVIDHERRVVQLRMAKFDSYLVGRAVTEVLPERHEVTAYRDDSKKDESWLTRGAPYDLSIDIGGVAYRAQVVRLLNGAGVSVALEPMGHAGSAQ